MLGQLFKELLQNSNIILKSDQDIHAFGRYTITKKNDRYQVYRGATLAAEPTSGKIALCWCVADKLGKNSLAQEITELDREIERRSMEITHYLASLEKSIDPVRRFVLSDRLLESRVRLRYAREHLDKCVNLAKYWQQKGFKDETARIGLKNQNSTNT